MEIPAQLMRMRMNSALVAPLIGLFAGPAISAPKVKPPPPSTSTVLIKLEVPDSLSKPQLLRTPELVPFTKLGSHPIYSSNYRRGLTVLNTETKKVVEWLLPKPSPNESPDSLWILNNAPLGRYLITDYFVSDFSLKASQSLRRDIRCEITISGPNVAIYYGTISILPSSSYGIRIKPGDIDDAVRDFYERFVPFKRSELIKGEMKQEIQ